MDSIFHLWLVLKELHSVKLVFYLRKVIKCAISVMIVAV